MKTLKCVVLGSLVAFSFGACGDDADGGGGAPLMCDSIAFCSNHDLTEYSGEVPAAEGGDVADGLYRLEYSVTTGSAFEDDVQALQIRGNSYHWARTFGSDQRGSFTTDGTAITFAKTHECLFGAEYEPDATSDTLQFTATNDRITLISTFESTRTQRVFVRINDPSVLCETVDTEPASPGSYSGHCYVTNCGCIVATGQALTTEECDFNWTASLRRSGGAALFC